MATHSSIEWTDTTWNPVVGCTKVSEGCRNCYAMRMAARLAAMAGADIEAGRDPGRKGHYVNVVRYAPDEPGKDRDPIPLPQWNNKVALVENALADPLRWKKPRRVFVNSMSDLFHRDVPVEFIGAVWAVMHLTRQHTYQILTKRPERMHDVMPGVFEAMAAVVREMNNGDTGIIEWPLPNVWLGTSVEDQATADERIPHLLRCPAAVRFLSCEPLLGPVDLSRAIYSYRCPECGEPSPMAGHGRPQYTCCQTTVPLSPAPVVDWIIVGGESGPGARPCNVEWIRSIVKQCQDANVPVFVKQLGACAFDEPNGIAGAALKVDNDVAPLVTRRFRDPKGADPSEWPEDLRVREFPEVEVA